jgi:two-component system LytT family response regulator
MMTAVIVDDEPNAVDAIAIMLGEHCPGVRVVGTASSWEEAVARIRATEPDLVFLDIEMPHGSGFRVLEAFPDRTFAPIFVTAHDRYAIRAIRFSALDYLLKPVDHQELVLAVARARENRAAAPSVRGRIRALERNLRSDAPSLLAVPTLEGFEFVDVSTIVRVAAAGRYSTIHLVGPKTLLVSRNLGEFEKLLDETGFLRVHHSHLVNLAHVKSFLRRDGGQAVFTDGSRVPVARARRDAFLERMHVG